MSSNTQVRVTAFTLAAAAIARSLATMRDLAVDLSDVERWELGSASEERLEDLLTEVRASSQPAGAALETFIASSLVLDRISLHVAGDAREAARAALGEARALAEAGDQTAAAAAFARAESGFLRAIASAQEVLAPIEAGVTRQAIAGALAKLGYDDIRASRRGDLRARRRSDGRLVYARLDAGKALELDLAGHDGVTCRAHLAEILEALRDGGVEMRTPELEYHGSRSGGPVAHAVEAAAKAGAPGAAASAQPAAAARPGTRTARLQPIGEE